MHIKLFNPLFIILLFISISISSAQESSTTKKFKFGGDFRFRTEHDWNSRKTDGSYRDDRDRLRIRLRLGAKYQLNNTVSFGAMLRTGNPSIAQSPHVTLGNGFRSKNIMISRAYAKFDFKENYWGWIGKNSMPFWQPYELLWDTDVTPEGVSLGANYSLKNNSKLSPVAGYYVYNSSGHHYDSDSNVIIGQLKWDPILVTGEFSVSTGFIYGEDLPNKPIDNPDYYLNYSIWASSLKYSNSGFSFIASYYQNLKSYDTNINIDDVYKDQKTGFSAGLFYKINKFQFSYTYSYIEKYAIVEYFGQDDYVRWGGINYTSASNIKGSDINLQFTINKSMNICARGFIAKGIKTTDLTTNTGNRIRIDFNLRF